MTSKEYKATSVVIGRKPRQKPDEFKTAFIKIYACKEPLYADDFPEHEIDIPNTERVIIHGPPVHYFLEGNDIVFDGVKKVTITKKPPIVEVFVE